MIRWSDRDEDQMVSFWESEQDVTWELATEVPESFVMEVK